VGLNTDIRKGLYDRFRSLPMWQPAPLLGALPGDVFRCSVASALILVVGFILGFRPQGGAAGVLLAVALVLVFSFALSWLWIVVGMLVRTPAAASRDLMHGRPAGGDVLWTLVAAAAIVAVAAPIARRLYRKER
jgi:ABC-2 type transport system permease protein